MRVTDLPPAQRSTVLLYARGYSFAEIAEIRFCAWQTVAANVKRAKAAYRKAGVDVSTQTKLLIRFLHEGVLTVDTL